MDFGEIYSAIFLTWNGGEIFRNNFNFEFKSFFTVNFKFRRAYNHYPSDKLTTALIFLSNYLYRLWPQYRCRDRIIHQRNK